jgi:hypothetical protein
MSDHDDYQIEPIPGLPAVPPKGEHILWQGTPDWRVLAREVFHIRVVVAYFALLMLWRCGSTLLAGGDRHMALLALLAPLPIALIGVGLLALLARLSARSTVYTITNRRVVMRIGIALPTAINVPFKLIGTASLRVGQAGHGDIPLALRGDERIAYSNLWPHVRPWHLARPEPMLRGIPDAAKVAELLGAALSDSLPLNADGVPLAALKLNDLRSQTVKGASMPVAAKLGLST